MTVPELPGGTSPSLKLTHPTEQEIISQWKKNGVFWRGPLSFEAYLRRERYLLQAPLAKDGGLTHWVLVDSDTEDRRVYAGCESLTKRALIARDGQVEEVLCHGIGSVFSPPEFRGKGYGLRLMKEIGPRLETWKTQRFASLFSILFSDIGKVSSESRIERWKMRPCTGIKPLFHIFMY
jgi:GNAT superfamily N-acetyltransferase